LLLALLTVATKAKVFSWCKLAHVLQEEGLDGYRGYSLANWLCMAFYKSTFNTAAQSIKGDGSAHYGIFQFSSQLWHTSDRRPSDNHCRMACRSMKALPLQGQPQKKQPEASLSAQLHSLAKMELGDLLFSNITDDIICAKRIMLNPQGMNAWEGWAMHFRGRDLSEWVEGCDLRESPQLSSSAADGAASTLLQGEGFPLAAQYFSVSICKPNTFNKV
ncbi:lysozyme C, milk isozyme-like, partial [Falco biarmicus]|uniref:lysozyme C, milk isozyme-like n=1 Tax=Falco biarmicus TaxID=345155 RepID=UPI0024BC8FC6